MKQVWVASHEVVITTSKLAALERKAAAHDGYVAASRIMGAAQHEQLGLRKQAREAGDKEQGLYSMGWLDCLYAWNDAVVQATARIMEEQE